MKNHHFWTRAFLLCAPVTLISFAYAAPNTTKKLNDSIKSKVTVPDLKKVGPERTRIGEKYNLWMSINPTDCNDPMYPGKSNPYDDHAFECYGQLYLNGRSYWNVPKEWANNGFAKIGHRDLPEPGKVNPKTQGYRLNRPWQTLGSKGEPFKFEVRDTNAASHKVNIALKLYDIDQPVFFDDGPYNTPPERNDDVVGDFKVSIDLSKLEGSDGRYYWFWNGKDESGNGVGTNLYVFAEHVGPIYASGGGGKPSYEQPPVIERGKLPGKIPGPGPVIRR